MALHVLGPNAGSRCSSNVLREHLAYEIHYLVLAACRFPDIDTNEAAFYQDSALLHARNLLEFTKPVLPRFGLWIKEVGGNRFRTGRQQTTT